MFNFRVIQSQFHPHDAGHPESWKGAYEMKYTVAKIIRPKSILEFGVRCGYSAMAFLQACPDAHYEGVDSNGDVDGGFTGSLAFARELLKNQNVRFHEMTTREFGAEFLDRINQGPSWDLVHVDADHSFDGCLYDLYLAAAVRPKAILCDDSDAIEAVKLACEHFRNNCRGVYRMVKISDGYNGQSLFIPE
jgi:predicted O-methyltransferase YrrM